MRISSKLALRTNTHLFRCFRYALCKIVMAEDICNIRISSCFVDFDGVTEQLCKVTRHRLRKFLECRSKWAKLNCQQAEIVKKSYENIDDGLSRRKITRQSVLGLRSSVKETRKCFQR